MNVNGIEAPESLEFPVIDTGKIFSNVFAPAAPADSQNEAARKGMGLNQSEYERFREFVLEKTGLDFPDDKRQMLDRGLAKVMQVTQCNSLNDLYTILKNSPPTGAAWDELVSALTIGETYFFRHAPHIEALKTQIIPAILAQREYTSRQLRIWSAGCATGEEPYSIAILLRELIPSIESWNIMILATDINRDALRRARRGNYGAWSFRGVDKNLVDKYFRREGNQYVIADQVRHMVNFEYLNLVNDAYPSLTNNTNAMDIVLCRNVTIYFTSLITQAVLKKFHGSLVDGGWLIPGPSEPNIIFYVDYETQSFPGTVIYQKSKTPKSPPAIPVSATEPAPVWNRLPTVASTPAPFKPRTPIAPVRKSPIKFQPLHTAPVPAKRNEETTDPYQQALSLIDEGRNAEALTKLYEKLNQDAKFAPTYVALGKAYANLGQLAEAQQWCERALELDRLNPQPYYLLSMIYQENGTVENAIEALKKTVYLDRDFVLAHYSLAQLHLARGDKDAARKSLVNVQRLLAGKERESVVPEGDGLVVGRLQELVEGHLSHDV